MFHRSSLVTENPITMPKLISYKDLDAKYKQRVLIPTLPGYIAQQDLATITCKVVQSVQFIHGSGSNRGGVN